MNKTFLKLLLLVIILVVYAPQTFGQSKKKRAKIDAVVKEARTYLGTPYRFGGLKRSGIDCSGLMYCTFSAINVKLPRTAKAQSKFGRKKNWDNIRPGDIVFFKFKGKKGKWWHSGVITYSSKDDIRFVHASSSRGVVESSLMSDYYKDNVKRFRRVIK